MHQLGAQVLIAAILLPVIRDDGMIPVGASREWPKPEPADDRRGGDRVREGNSTHREAYEPERTVPALDPGGGSRCRPAAQHRLPPRDGENLPLVLLESAREERT
jgi:hypothetical protein